jgi:hypothetical protein
VRAIAPIAVIFAAALKFYPAIGGVILLDRTRSRREASWVFVAFIVATTLVALAETGSIRHYLADPVVPSGYFAFGLPVAAGFIAAPVWLTLLGSFVLLGGTTVAALILAPAFEVPVDERRDQLGFILGAVLTIGCYLATANYAYRLVFSIWMAPWLWSAWQRNSWPAWFRRLGRACGIFMVAVLWLDGLARLLVYSREMRAEEMKTAFEQLTILEQPVMGVLVLLLIALTVPWIRGSFLWWFANDGDGQGPLQAAAPPQA